MREQPNRQTPLTLDGHADTAQRFLDERWNFDDAIGDGMVSLAAARAGELHGQFFALWAEPTAWHGRFAHRTLTLLDAVLEQVRRDPHHLALCMTSDDVRAAYAAETFAVLLGVEGGHAIENDLGLLRLYHRLGVRYMTLTWSNTNEWCDSSGDLDDATVTHHGGLTRFGCEVIGEMNALGMMVDISHVSDAAFWHVVEASRAPIIASHSSARAVTAAPRNLTDEMMRAIAASGGLVMVNYFPAFLCEDWRAAWNAQRAERRVAHAALAAECAQRGEAVTFTASNRIDQEFARRLPRPSFSALVDHFDHILQVVGPEHVGLGSDFDGFPLLPEGFDTVADLPKLFTALEERGYDAETLRLIRGENLLRVMDTVQQAATR